MGFWNWLFGKKDYKAPAKKEPRETSAKKEGRQSGVPYGSVPKKPTDEIVPEFRVGNWEVARLTSKSVLIRKLQYREVGEQVPGTFGYMELVPCSEWVEYRTDYIGVCWYNKDGQELEWKLTKAIVDKLKARKLF